MEKNQNKLQTSNVIAPLLAPLPSSLAQQPCFAALPDSLALPGSLARQPSLAREPCLAALPGSLAEVLQV
jgi:hypothetical protein